MMRGMLRRVVVAARKGTQRNTAQHRTHIFLTTAHRDAASSDGVLGGTNGWGNLLALEAGPPVLSITNAMTAFSRVDYDEQRVEHSPPLTSVLCNESLFRIHDLYHTLHLYRVST